MATRALFTLDWIGHRRFAFLDGGLPKWKREGRPVTTDAPAVVRGHLAPQIRPELVADADWVSAHIGARGVSFIDTRSDVEYAGAGEHRGMPSAGHVAGARQLQWEQLFAPGDDLQLKPRKELEQMYNDRTRAGDTVVTYCWVGYRASATWFAARAIGRTVKLYDGSYQDWRKRQLPVTPGTTP
jgi:thiosulfate/3-mercaptopyruvate sulfurtransferase